MKKTIELDEKQIDQIQSMVANTSFDLHRHLVNNKMDQCEKERMIEAVTSLNGIQEQINKAKKVS